MKKTKQRKIRPSWQRHDDNRKWYGTQHEEAKHHITVQTASI